MSDSVPYHTIIATKTGDADALKSILKHYRPYIDCYSRRTFYDEYGKHYEFVDEDIRQRIEAKLLYQIIERFDPSQLPNGEELEV